MPFLFLLVSNDNNLRNSVNVCNVFAIKKSEQKSNVKKLANALFSI